MTIEPPLKINSGVGNPGIDDVAAERKALSTRVARRVIDHWSVTRRLRLSLADRRSR